MNPSMHWIGIFFAVDVINNNGILQVYIGRINRSALALRVRVTGRLSGQGTHLTSATLAAPIDGRCPPAQTLHTSSRRLCDICAAAQRGITCFSHMYNSTWPGHAALYIQPIVLSIFTVKTSQPIAVQYTVQMLVYLPCFVCCCAGESKQIIKLRAIAIATASAKPHRPDYRWQDRITNIYIILHPG